MDERAPHPPLAIIHRVLDHLVQERQSLRFDGARPVELEANRQAIVYWQRVLGDTLSAQHEPVAR